MVESKFLIFRRVLSHIFVTLMLMVLQGQLLWGQVSSKNFLEFEKSLKVISEIFLTEGREKALSQIFQIQSNVIDQAKRDLIIKSTRKYVNVFQSELGQQKFSSGIILLKSNPKMALGRIEEAGQVEIGNVQVDGAKVFALAQLKQCAELGDIVNYWKNFSVSVPEVDLLLDIIKECDSFYNSSKQGVLEIFVEEWKNVKGDRYKELIFLRTLYKAYLRSEVIPTEWVNFIQSDQAEGSHFVAYLLDLRWQESIRANQPNISMGKQYIDHCQKESKAPFIVGPFDPHYCARDKEISLEVNQYLEKQSAN